MSNATTELLRQRLAVLHADSIAIEDDSHLHAGHAGAKDGGHFRLTIVANVFSGKTTMARHRLVYDAVGDLMRGKIHALVIHARSPDEV
ncbi:MAG: BolA family transcriptional regulator [Rhodocyclales bacterium GT-UBC]|nr:MAG: BolA family transcriptional regulator [Rhodocyclales bacterium GT-UBC]